MALDKFNSKWEQRQLDNKFSEKDVMLSSGISEGQAFRRTIGAPDMSDKDWTQFQSTGVQPTQSFLEWKIKNVNLEDKVDVASLQYTMSVKGLYTGAIDGVPGDSTVKAMRKFQKKRDYSIMDNIMRQIKSIF
mgnify:CR=1 FL=1